MVFEMQSEISQLKESLQKLQTNRTGSDSHSDKLLDELRESQSKIHATILANVSKVVEKSNLDRNNAMNNLQETVNKGRLPHQECMYIQYALMYVRTYVYKNKVFEYTYESVQTHVQAHESTWE